MIIKQSWEEIEISSWKNFDQVINGMKHREWLFRGQSNAKWVLQTSLDRMFEDIQPIIRNVKGKDPIFAKEAHEKLLIKKFKSNANLYLPLIPANEKDIELLAIMQHYGAPTRLLDVTLSPHIATYFALESGFDDCSIYAFHQTAIKSANLENLKTATYEKLQDKIFDDKNDDEFLIVYEPEHGNQRLVIQQGLFLVASQIVPFEDILRAYSESDSQPICKKLVISANLRYEGLERLRRMNITSATLFPGIDGFCRSLKFQIIEPAKNQKLLD